MTAEDLMRQFQNDAGQGVGGPGSPPPAGADVLPPPRVVGDRFTRVDRSPSITNGYTPRQDYLDHQTYGLEKLSAKPAAAFLMDYGTGKSFMTVTNCGELAAGGEINGAVILAPKGNYEDWTLENPETSHWAQCANPSWLERVRVARWRGGHTKAEQREFQALAAWEGFSILVVNVEALSASRRAETLISAFMKDRRCLIAVDESTTVKSPKSQRTKAVLRLANLAPYRRILTGFPTPNGSLDLYSQFRFLDWKILGHTNFWTFRSRYAVLKKVWLANRSVDTVVGFKNTGELWDKIAPHSFRVLADDCLDLPERTYKIRSVEMTDEQARVYRDMADKCLSQVGDYWASSTVAITQLLRLHQIACGFVQTESGETVELPNRRVHALIELLDAINDKTVIWANFHECVRQIRERLIKEYGPRSVVEYHGDVGERDRQEAKARFAHDPDCRFFLATQASGGRGLNDLIVARNAVYYANNFDLEMRLNSEARTRRKGSERHSSVVYTDLITEDTMESKIVYALKRKINLASAVLSDGPREWLV